MNLIDACVTKVLSKPKKLQYGFYTVRVKYEDMGGKGETDVICNTLEDVKKVKKGYIFQH